MIKIEIEKEEEGLWVAEIPAIPGCMRSGKTPSEARREVIVLAFRIVADKLENGEEIPPEFESIFSGPA